MGLNGPETLLLDSCRGMLCGTGATLGQVQLTPDTRIQLREGTHSAQLALMGAGVLGGGFLLLGVIAGTDSDLGGYIYPLALSSGVVAGYLIGSLVGAVLPRWVSVSHAGSRQASLQVALPFSGHRK
jgi:hypothetical protein